MSLINNMLKDLAKREQQPQHLSSLKITQINQTSMFSAQKKWILLGAILCLILFCGIFLSFNKLAPGFRWNNKIKSPEFKATPFAQTAEPLWLKPAIISAISLQEKVPHSELTFLLDHPSFYRLAINDLTHELIITFDHAQSNTALPSLNLLSNGIQSISAQPYLNRGIQFKLKLADNTELEAVNLINENSKPELVISLEQHDLTNTLKYKSSVPLVKTPAMESLISQQYQSALSFAQKGDFTNAITRLSNLLKADPEFKSARTTLAALLLDQGNARMAKQIINQGLALDAEYVPFIELKSRILTMEGKLSDALGLLLSASPAMTDNPDYHAFIAALYERTNNDLLAIRVYKNLLEINPDNGNWWFGLAVSLDKIGQRGAAKDSYTKAMTSGHLSLASSTYIQNRLAALQDDNYAS